MIGAAACVVGIANLISGFLGGGILTVLAFIAAGACLGLALEMRYVSRRIERNANFAKPS